MISLMKTLFVLLGFSAASCICCSPLQANASAQPVTLIREHVPALTACQAEKTVPPHHLDGNREELSKQLDHIFAQYGVKGCSVAAFAGEEIVYTHSYGMARSNQPACADTKYRIASISKAVTASLAMHLVDEGKLSLDDDIAAIHPSLQNPVYPQDRATLQMLPGIIDGAGYNNALSYGRFPPLDVVMQYNNFSGKRPGESYSYSNFGLGLVCAAIEQATGQAFREYSKEVLFEPLGIDAGFMTDDIEDRQNIAALGTVDPLRWGSMAGAYSAIPLGQMYLLGQGELYISAQDLAKIGMILAGDGSFSDKNTNERVQFLSKEALKQMHTPLVYDKETNTTRGLALQQTKDIVEDVSLWGHQGNAYGVISCLFYDRSTNRGVAFLTNSASQSRAESKVYAVNDAVVKTVWQYLVA